MSILLPPKTPLLLMREFGDSTRATLKAYRQCVEGLAGGTKRSQRAGFGYGSLTRSWFRVLTLLGSTPTQPTKHPHSNKNTPAAAKETPTIPQGKGNRGSSKGKH